MNVPILLIDYGCGCVTVTVNTFQTFPHLEKSPFLVFKWIALISLIGFLTNCIHPLSIPPPFFLSLMLLHVVLCIMQRIACCQIHQTRRFQRYKIFSPPPPRMHWKSMGQNPIGTAPNYSHQNILVKKKIVVQVHAIKIARGDYSRMNS